MKYVYVNRLTAVKEKRYKQETEVTAQEIVWNSSSDKKLHAENKGHRGKTIQKQIDDAIQLYPTYIPKK